MSGPSASTGVYCSLSLSTETFSTFNFKPSYFSSTAEMTTTGNSLAGEGMYSQLIEDEGSYDEFNSRPDVGLGGKASPQSRQVFNLFAESSWRN